METGFPRSVNGVHFRAMGSVDLGDIIEIERASFAYPWSTAFFLQELKVTCARSLLALVDDTPVAYIIYWLLRSEIDVHNLAVHPAYRRRGIAKTLLEAVIDEGRCQGVDRVTLEVRKSNAAAQRLYHSLGFIAKGVRKGYYSDDGEDALVMALDLDGQG